MVELLLSYSKLSDQGPRIRRLLDLPRRASSEGDRSPKLKPHTHLSELQLAELVATYLAGATVYELAQSNGIPRDRVSRILEDAGVDRRYHETRHVDLARAEELHRSGLTITEVAARMGVGRTTLIVARRRARAAGRA